MTVSDYAYRDRDRALRALQEAWEDGAEAQLKALESQHIELVTPARQRIRELIPHRWDKFVILDVDMGLHAIRNYEQPNAPDEEGGLMLLELKWGNARVTEAQRRTFRLLDRLCRRGDGTEGRYWGFHLVRYEPTPGGLKYKWWVDNTRVAHKQEFTAWLRFDEDVHRYYNDPTWLEGEAL